MLADSNDFPTDIPAFIADAKLWLDGENINGQGNAGLDSGDAVSAWVDLSGSDHHASQSNSSAQPVVEIVNGK